MRMPLATFWLSIGLSLCPAFAFGQTVTLSELEGATVEAQASMVQQIRREGREFQVQRDQRIKVFFRPGDMIEWSLSSTSHTPRGTKQGPIRTGTTAIGKPREARHLGGGQSVWIFEDGTLTTLRTYGGEGGYKRTIAFARQGDAITCTAKETFVREEGVGRVELRSAIDDAPVTVLSAKQVGSTCRVTRP